MMHHLQKKYGPLFLCCCLLMLSKTVFAQRTQKELAGMYKAANGIESKEDQTLLLKDSGKFTLSYVHKGKSHSFGGTYVLQNDSTISFYSNPVKPKLYSKGIIRDNGTLIHIYSTDYKKN